MATLVETVSSHHHHTTLRHHRTNKRKLSISFNPSTIPLPSNPHDNSTAQIVHLASQHHGSEYNRLKFGPRGCPILYVPMTFHMPELVRELQARQIACTGDRAWWPCSQPQQTTGSAHCASLNQPLLSLGPGGSSVADTDRLEQELSAAISTPLPDSVRLIAVDSTAVQMKTSKTHPLNISSIISPEALPLISLNLTPLPTTSPVMFDIAPAYQLDRFTLHSEDLRRFAHVPPPPPSPTSDSSYSDLSRVTIAKSLRTPSTRFQSQSSITSAIQAAINTGLRASSMQGSNAESSDVPRPTMSILTVPRAWTFSGSDSLSRASLMTESACSNVEPDIPSAPYTHTSLGNMFLSSCPGKKVRLSGPIRGRSGVCRDLYTDLMRMKALGVTCVICCLDDTELELLGVPWSEYARIAHQVGVDMLRIPIPEGLPPLSLSSLDEHLLHVINTYTRKGLPILVHCRGGVGRAGLIACCWMLKLGLCGWIETDLPWCGVEEDEEPALRRDTLQLVERAIGVVRRRRSVKAIETYEQVKFLVDFVEYLRETSAGGGVVRSP